ncbi:MAG TPA: hypothetical protein VF624_18105 [Tepidisphaeraceae bacterium]|jgi:hypothetical protein
MNDDDLEEASTSPDPSKHPMVSNQTLAQIEQSAAILLVEEPEAELLHWLNLSAVLLASAKQIRQRVEQVAIGWIEQNGPVEVGDIRYTAGHAKIVKCLHVSRCMELVLEACRGDFDSVVLHLRSDPWKYGSVRSLLSNEAYEQLFQTESKPKLVEGKPQKQLITTDTRFASFPRLDTDQSEDE